MAIIHLKCFHFPAHLLTAVMLPNLMMFTRTPTSWLCSQSCPTTAASTKTRKSAPAFTSGTRKKFEDLAKITRPATGEGESCILDLVRKSPFKETLILHAWESTGARSPLDFESSDLMGLSQCFGFRLGSFW